MELKLVKASYEYKEQIRDMLREWIATGEKIVPWAIRSEDLEDFNAYLAKVNGEETRITETRVPATTWFCLDTERNVMVGAVNIRHYLNERLLLDGGHIGDGVRPSERRKGIATKMIGLALEKCREMGFLRVLMVCDKENVGSAKSIQNNGGVLENEVEVDGKIEQRYWITL